MASRSQGKRGACRASDSSEGEGVPYTLGDFHFHDLRHTYASRLVRAGVDLAVLRELLGHKDFKMILRYAHLAPSNLNAAVAILDRADLQKTCNPPETPAEQAEAESPASAALSLVMGGVPGRN